MLYVMANYVKCSSHNGNKVSMIAKLNNINLNFDIYVNLIFL